MELLAGQSLADRLDDGPRLGLGAAVILARRIALGLMAAHEHGVVHRDVKPDNIFLVRDGDGGPVEQVKLLDFGIARLFEAGRALRHTTTGTVMGTPLYMSPEQCRGAAECDHRSDLYSLGCVVFEMLTGDRPFCGDSMGELLLAHLTVPAPDVRTLAPEVPADVASIVDWLLAKDPAHRPEHASALVAALGDVIDRHGFDRRSSAMPVAWPPRGTPTTLVTTRPRPTRPLLAAGAGIAVAAMVAAVLGLSQRAPAAAPIAVDDAVPVRAAEVRPSVEPIVTPAPTSVVEAPAAAPAPAPAPPPPPLRKRRVRAEVVAPDRHDDAAPAVDVDTIVTDVAPRPPPRR